MSRNKGHPDEKKEKKFCGAKKKNGELCKNNRLLPNGRCKHHGGYAGAPKGNKNRETHGRWTQIMFSSFTDEEMEIATKATFDPLEQIEYDLAIINVRLKRMLDRYAKAKNEQYTITTIEETQSQIGNRQSNEIKTIKENNDLFLHKMDTEINKVQNMKLKLLAQKAQLESQRNQDEGVDISKVVDAITTTDVWNDDDEEE